METDTEFSQGFMFGIIVTEYVHEVKRPPFREDRTMDKIIDTLQEIVKGDLTIVPAPEELAATMPGLPEKLRATLPGLLRGARESQKAAAAKMLQQMGLEE